MSAVSAAAGPGALTREAREVGEDVDAARGLAERLGRHLPLPGGGATRDRWRLLAAVARGGLTAARVLEAHADALAILAEAGHARPSGTWGVFAAEHPPGTDEAPLRATDGPDGPRLTGSKPWCSLADRLDHALVTAHTTAGRALFAVDLRHPSVRVRPVDGWAARGLRTVTSTGVDLDGTPAEPVGGAGWYLGRPGFAWGGMGVAACWAGGARGLADAVTDAARRRPGDLPALHAGTADAALTAADAVLDTAATAVDAGTANGAAGALWALRVRAVVADAAERVLRTAAHALGPAPLAFDPEHAGRVADLELYVRQHHAERDLAELGRTVAAGTVADGTVAP